MERMTQMSPRSLARMAGLLYVLEGMAAGFGQIWIPATLVVSADAAATAANILQNETMFRLSLAAGFVAVALHIAETVLFYVLFKPVNRSVAILFVLVSVVALALQAVSSLFQLPVLTILGGGDGMGAFSVEESQSLALLFLRLRAQAFNVYLLFFGFRCAVTGYLIYRSTFLPRLIGALKVLAGVGYLALLWPPLAIYLFPFHLLLAAPGELSLVAWFLVVGVNNERWREQARRAAGRESLHDAD